MKRFLDDFLKIFVGSTKLLHKIFEEINKIHLNIKLTISHTSNKNKIEADRCSCEPQEEVAFLDTSCKIVNGKVILDLFRKETDRNMYLLPSSCHPLHQTKNIPYSLAMRIVRICSETETRDQRLKELKEFLVSRQYPNGLVLAALDKAKQIHRKKVLEYVVKPRQSKRPVFVVSWDPRLPSMDALQQKHWRAMTNDPYLKEVFPEPPITAFKKQKNIRDLVIRARVPIKTRNKRYIKGMKKCKGCVICPFIMERKEVKEKNISWKKSSPINCQTYNLGYMIECTKERCDT